MSAYDHDDAIRTMIRRATILSVEDAGSQQLVKARGFGGEEFEGAHRPQTHGLSSSPPAGSEGLMLSMGGRADRPLMLGFEHKDSRIKGQQPGWTSLYDDKGNVISMVGAGGMKVKSNTDNISVQVPDGKKVYLGGDGTAGSYQRVMTESGVSTNIWARTGWIADPLVRTSEACDEQPFLLWDTRWSNDTFSGDWALADADETLNRGGLRAKAAIETAVILALFTDRRIPDDHPLRYLAGADPGGWWGDGIDVRDDLGEAELGSYLWVLFRAPLTEDIVRWAKAMAEEALAPLVQQRVCVRADVVAERDEVRGRLSIIVQLYARNGETIYERNFTVAWAQLGI